MIGRYGYNILYSSSRTILFSCHLGEISRPVSFVIIYRTWGRCRSLVLSTVQHRTPIPMSPVHPIHTCGQITNDLSDNLRSFPRHLRLSCAQSTYDVVVPMELGMSRVANRGTTTLLGLGVDIHNGRR